MSKLNYLAGKADIRLELKSNRAAQDPRLTGDKGFRVYFIKTELRIFTDNCRD